MKLTSKQTCPNYGSPIPENTSNPQSKKYFLDNLDPQKKYLSRSVDPQWIPRKEGGGGRIFESTVVMSVIYDSNEDTYPLLKSEL